MSLLLPSQRKLIRPPRGLTHWWSLDSSSTDFSASAMVSRPNVGNIYASGQSVGRAREMPFATRGLVTLSNYSNTTAEFCTLNADPFGGSVPTSFSSACWLYFTSFATPDLADPRPICFSSNDYVLAVNNATGSVLINYNTLSVDVESSPFTFAANTWYHVVVAISGGNACKLYINGVDTTVVSSSADGGTAGVWGLLCRSATERNSQASMYDLMLCVGTTLSADEAASLYSSYFIPDQLMPTPVEAAAAPTNVNFSNLLLMGVG